MLPVSGVIATTGECAQYAAAMAVTKLVIPGPVLGDTNAMLATRPRITVRHMRRPLLMNRRNKADPRRRKNIQRIHISRTDDAKDILHFIGNEASQPTPHWMSFSSSLVHSSFLGSRGPAPWIKIRPARPTKAGA